MPKIYGIWSHHSCRRDKVMAYICTIHTYHPYLHYYGDLPSNLSTLCIIDPAKACRLYAGNLMAPASIKHPTRQRQKPAPSCSNPSHYIFSRSRASEILSRYSTYTQLCDIECIVRYYICRQYQVDYIHTYLHQKYTQVCTSYEVCNYIHVIIVKGGEGQHLMYAQVHANSFAHFKNLNQLNRMEYDVAIKVAKAM